MLVSERHYTIRELAELWFDKRWKTFYHLVRRWFVHPDGTLEAGVINAGSGRRHKRILIPETVAARIYRLRMKGGV